MRAPCPRVSIVRAYPAPSCTCPAHTCAQALFARGCHSSFVCIDLSPRLLAYGLLGGCTQAPWKMWYMRTITVRYTANDGRSFVSVTFVYLLEITLAVMPRESHHSPLPLPPGHIISRVFLSQATTIGGNPSPQSWARDVDTCDRRAAANLTSGKPLPSPCTAVTSHLSFHSHNTLACNHPPPHPHTLHTVCQRP